MTGLRFGATATVAPRKARFRIPGALRAGPGQERELAMASLRDGLTEAYTFDDILLESGRSQSLPSDAGSRAHIARAITPNIPIIASPMDTVTEARMAIAMAQAGGMGVLHRNFDIERQAAQVRQVKKYESCMVVNPL